MSLGLCYLAQPGCFRRLLFVTKSPEKPVPGDIYATPSGAFTLAYDQDGALQTLGRGSNFGGFKYHRRPFMRDFCQTPPRYSLFRLLSTNFAQGRQCRELVSLDRQFEFGIAQYPASYDTEESPRSRELIQCHPVPVPSRTRSCCALRSALRE
jgi:hypothetical protein